MARHIIKLSDEGEDFYLEWSTEMRMPVSYGMSLDAFKAYYVHEYGRQRITELHEKLQRVEDSKTSCIQKTLDSLLQGNNAGKHGRELSEAEIIKHYCKRAKA